MHSFPLARGDHSGKVNLPQRVYGRQSELQELLGSFDRVSRGATELMLVSGYSGVGKSALVYELRTAVASRGGYFVSGKFEQLNRSAPYESVARALDVPRIRAVAIAETTNQRSAFAFVTDHIADA